MKALLKVRSTYTAPRRGNELLQKAASSLFNLQGSGYREVRVTFMEPGWGQVIGSQCNLLASSPSGG